MKFHHIGIATENIENTIEYLKQLFVIKEIYDKYVLNKTYKFICKLSIYENNVTRIDIKDVM